MNVFTYTAFKVHTKTAGKAIISFNVGGNPNAQWTFVDYFRVWVNDPNLDLATVDGNYTGNKLDKNTYTAQTALMCSATS